MLIEVDDNMIFECVFGPRLYTTQPKETQISLFRRIFAYQGEVVEQGLKSKILNPPYPDYTELLLSSVPEMDPDWLTNLLNKRSS